MSRYQPTADEQAAIDRLTLAGYAVVRQGTYDNLRKRLDEARWENEWRIRDKEASEAWAHRECEMQRHLADRLNAVIAAAASLGVGIDAINEALGTTAPARTTERD